MQATKEHKEAEVEEQLQIPIPMLEAGDLTLKTLLKHLKNPTLLPVVRWFRNPLRKSKLVEVAVAVVAMTTLSLTLKVKAPIREVVVARTTTTKAGDVVVVATKPTTLLNSSLKIRKMREVTKINKNLRKIKQFQPKIPHSNPNNNSPPHLPPNTQCLPIQSISSRLDMHRLPTIRPQQVAAEVLPPSL